MFINTNIQSGTLNKLEKKTIKKLININSLFRELELVNNCNNNIIPIQYVVCNNNEDDIVFYQANTNTLSTINKLWLTSPDSRFYKEPYKEIICKTITIDKMIEIYGIPELIKIDVEGGEYQCILSLSQKVENLCFEWAAETNKITVLCLEYLQTLGFSKFYLQSTDEYLFRPDESIYYDIDTILNKLQNTIAKKDWGMLWCK